MSRMRKAQYMVWSGRQEKREERGKRKERGRREEGGERRAEALALVWHEGLGGGRDSCTGAVQEPPSPVGGLRLETEGESGLMGDPVPVSHNPAETPSLAKPQV